MLLSPALPHPSDARHICIVWDLSSVRRGAPSSAPWHGKLLARTALAACARRDVRFLTISRYTGADLADWAKISSRNIGLLHLGIDDYLRIIGMKTGSLFAVAAELGSMLSRADPETQNSLKTYGQKIGTAYQIYDDCIDIAGTERLTGKTLGSDLRKGKLTLPVLMLLGGRNGSDKEHLSQLILDARFEEAWASRVFGEIAGLSVPFISLEMLKRNKAATNRTQDLADLEHL